MSQSQIRLTRTPEIDNALSFLRDKYPLLSEAEIIKMVLSEKYIEKMEESTNIIDLESRSDLENIKKEIRIPLKHDNLLSLAGSFSGPKDMSTNKKKYIY